MYTNSAGLNSYFRFYNERFERIYFTNIEMPGVLRAHNQVSSLL